jgi:hypothetical protein
MKRITMMLATIALLMGGVFMSAPAANADWYTPTATVRRPVLQDFQYSPSWPGEFEAGLRVAHVGEYVTDADLENGRLIMLAEMVPPFLGPEEPMP